MGRSYDDILNGSGEEFEEGINAIMDDKDEHVNPATHKTIWNADSSEITLGISEEELNAILRAETS